MENFNDSTQFVGMETATVDYVIIRTLWCKMAMKKGFAHADRAVEKYLKRFPAQEDQEMIEPEQFSEPHRIIGLPEFDEFLTGRGIMLNPGTGYAIHSNLILLRTANDEFTFRFTTPEFERDLLNAPVNKQFARTIFDRLAQAEWIPSAVEDFAVAHEIAVKHADLIGSLNR